MAVLPPRRWLEEHGRQGLTVEGAAEAPAWCEQQAGDVLCVPRAALCQTRKRAEEGKGRDIDAGSPISSTPYWPDTTFINIEYFAIVILPLLPPRVCRYVPDYWHHWTLNLGEALGLGAQLGCQIRGGVRVQHTWLGK